MDNQTLLDSFEEIRANFKDLFQRVLQLEAEPKILTASGGGAPVDAEYLVNSANAILTNEIVVTAAQGRIIYSDGTPTWTTLNVGTAYQLLGVNVGGTLPEWQSFDWDNVASAAAADMVHDHSNNTEGGQLDHADLINVLADQHHTAFIGLEDTATTAVSPAADDRIQLNSTSGALSIVADAGNNKIDFTVNAAGVNHNLLSVTHSDTVTNAVTRGSLVYGNITPAWDELTHPGGAGYAFTTDANDVLWDQTPLWTGLHTFDAGWTLQSSVGTIDATSYLSAHGIRVARATASALDVPWQPGDTLTTLFVGASALANNQTAISAIAYSSYGINSVSTTGIGARASSVSNFGLEASSTSSNAVNATSSTGIAGYFNLTGAGTAIFQVADNGTIALEVDDGSFVGVRQTGPSYPLHVPWIAGDAAGRTMYVGSTNASNDQTAILGESYSEVGTAGVSVTSNGGNFGSTSGDALYAETLSATATKSSVWGYAANGARAVYGQSVSSGVGVQGDTATGVAGLFNLTGAGTAILQAQDNGTIVFEIDDGGDAYFVEYIRHYGDSDTNLRFQTDQLTINVGGVEFVDMVEAASDYIEIGVSVGVGIIPQDNLHVDGGVKSTSATAGGIGSYTTFYYSTNQGVIMCNGPDATTRGGFSLAHRESDNGNLNVGIELEPNGDLFLGKSLGNVYIGTTTLSGGTANHLLLFGDNSGNPTPGTNTAGCFAKDVGGTVEFFGVDEAGNVTQLTSHPAGDHLPFTPDPWEYILNTENNYIGKQRFIRVEKAVRKLEELTGEQFIFDVDIDKLDWYIEQTKQKTRKPRPAWMKEFD